MKNTPKIYLFCSVTLLFLIVACRSFKTPITYEFGLRSIKLNSDGTYKAYNSTGIWKKNGKSVFLTSYYRPDSINDLQIVNSKSNTNTNCIIKMLNYSGHESLGNLLLLYNNTHTDTFIFISSPLVPFQIADKTKDYNYCQILQWHKLNKEYSYSVSNLIPIRLTDTLTVYYDYPEFSTQYRFFENEEFLIRKNKIVPILEE